MKMATPTHQHNLAVLLLFGLICVAIADFPANCKIIECPAYKLIEQGNGFEIRSYNSTIWIATPPIPGISFRDATRTGFLRLFNYISGKNYEEKKIEMTAPVLTEVFPGNGPLCQTTFIVGFYVPKVNQPDPPAAEGLYTRKWAPTYMAVSQFGGFADDYDIGKEAAALKASLAGTKWYAAVEASRKSSKSPYAVVQYNAPFEFEDRVNEIWFAFDASSTYAM